MSRKNKTGFDPSETVKKGPVRPPNRLSQSRRKRRESGKILECRFGLSKDGAIDSYRDISREWQGNSGVCPGDRI